MDKHPTDDVPPSRDTVEAAVRVVVGLSLLDAGDVAAASDVFQKATLLAPHYPGAHLMYAQTLLARGEFLAGWSEFAWRKPFNEITQRLIQELEAPEWTGERMEGGRLFVLCDEGVGDAIMFARYLPLVAKRVDRVILGWGPEHVALFTGIDGVSVVLNSSPSRTEFDCYTTICDLPRIFGTTVATIPAPIPYMPLDERKKREWRTRLDSELPAGRLRVGINWAGGQRHTRDAQRSLAFEQLSPLLEIEGISFVSLQDEVRDRDRAALATAKNVLDASASLESFIDTAALIANLDLVVSVDTAVAHLSGALGAPVWVLLPQPADWRWLLDRNDTPWYPTMRLIRQQRYGDWTPVLAEAQSQLRRLAAREHT